MLVLMHPYQYHLSVLLKIPSYFLHTALYITTPHSRQFTKELRRDRKEVNKQYIRRVRHRHGTTWTRTIHVALTQGVMISATSFDI